MIFHAKKPNGFVMVSNTVLNDNRLSLKAKGVLCYLLSKPPDWRPLIADICAHCRDKEESVRTALKELAKYGYAKLSKEAGEGGRWEGSQWVIFESPEPSEMAVSRISEKRHLKIPIRSTNKTKEIVLSERLPEPSNGWSPAPRETIIQENEELISRLLVGHTEDKFVEQWRKRSREAPWRTLVALAELDEEIAANPKKIANRGGYANAWYLNYGKQSKISFSKCNQSLLK